MNYQGIQKVSLVDGEGIRTVLWVSGCNHHCKGCHNPDTWDPDSGPEFDLDSLATILDHLEKPYIDGLTLSGGDPMFPENRKTVTLIAEIAKSVSGKSIWMYTGYLFSQIQDEPILNYLDVIVDGEFKEDLRDESYKWAGSTNQIVWRKNGSGIWEPSL